jgi:hypothetical protein
VDEWRKQFSCRQLWRGLSREEFVVELAVEPLLSRSFREGCNESGEVGSPANVADFGRLIAILQTRPCLLTRMPNGGSLSAPSINGSQFCLSKVPLALATVASNESNLRAVLPVESSSELTTNAMIL